MSRPSSVVKFISSNYWLISATGFLIYFTYGIRKSAEAMVTSTPTCKIKGQPMIVEREAFYHAPTGEDEDSWEEEVPVSILTIRVCLRLLSNSCSSCRCRLLMQASSHGVAATRRREVWTPRCICYIPNMHLLAKAFIMEPKGCHWCRK